MRFLAELPRFAFFTGKGGVGKTSVACATAVSLAERGRRVLLVSTDPASNVGQVFGQEIGNRVTPVAAVPGLDALEIDPEQAASDYRERTLAPVRDLLSPKDLAAVTEQLSGSCTTEIASFNEFTALLAGAGSAGIAADGYDHVVFDTAPTGHTIRLLRLPGEWTSFLDDGLGDASCLGPMSGLDRTRATYAAALAALSDPARTRVVLVARPQAAALREADRTLAELAEAGVRATHLVVNGVLPAGGDDPFAEAVRRREASALGNMPAGLAALERDDLPLRAVNMVGVEALRLLTSPDADRAPGSRAADEEPASAETGSQVPGLGDLVDELTRADHGLIMCLGKGGVGKTTVAAAVAVALARRGKDVHLTTTDPASHLSDALGEACEGLTVSSIDPEQAVADYRARVMATKGKGLDEAGRANLAEDLRSPCTEEVAVFQAFSRAVAEAKRRFVVMDTAPTGHTLLLLDATGSYHREIVRNLAAGASFTTPMMRLADPDYTKAIIVTLPEPTPVLEARALADDLERAGIHPWAWVIDQALTGTPATSPLLRRRAALEDRPISDVVGAAGRVALVPLREESPVGADALAALAGTGAPVG